jgi:hypothetical protein
VAVRNDQTTDIQPLINNNTFEQNIRGVSLFIASDKNITSVIQNNVFTHNQYGLFTCQTSCIPEGTGMSQPLLQDNDFNNNSLLPIYLNGPAFPTYIGNTFIGYPTSNQRLGIGLGGHFNHNGLWPIVNSAADGSGINMPYVVVENTTIDSGTSIIVPPTAIIKFTLSKWIDVIGTLTLQSASSEQTINFTSIRDDIGGDTNGDGTDTEPLPGDWSTLYLENSSTTVQYIAIKYSQYGLTIWNPFTYDINPSITNSSFIKNVNGLQLHPIWLTHYSRRFFNRYISTDYYLKRFR